MPTSVRTHISAINTKDFEEFLRSNEILDFFVGEYTPSSATSSRRNICYAYPMKSTSLETLTLLILRYGDIESAYQKYIDNKNKNKNKNKVRTN